MHVLYGMEHRCFAGTETPVVDGNYMLTGLKYVPTRTGEPASFKRERMLEMDLLTHEGKDILFAQWLIKIFYNSFI